MGELLIPLILWARYSAISAGNVHFFRGIQKSFPRTRTRTRITTTTTTTNKPFPRPRQRSLVVKKVSWLNHHSGAIRWSH